MTARAHNVEIGQDGVPLGITDRGVGYDLVGLC